MLKKRILESDRKQRNSFKSDLLSGFLAGWPICLGYVPLGLTLGVLGQKAGLSPLTMGLMSLFVFAGSAQFIAVAMIMENASPLSIVMTTFIVNLRHLLMSSSLSLKVKGNGKNKAVLSAFAHTVTDESFMVNMEKFNQEDWNINRAMAVNYTAYIAWFFSTVLGTVTGQYISENAFGMDYALTAMFICLLAFQLKSKLHLITGLFSGAIAVVAALYVPGNWYIIIGSVTAATLTLALQSRTGIAKEKNRHV